MLINTVLNNELISTITCNISSAQLATSVSFLLKDGSYTGKFWKSKCPRIDPYGTP